MTPQEEKDSLNRAGICPICLEYGHPEEAHMEIDGYYNRLYDFALGDIEPEPMSLEDEMQNYPERFWENPETGEWERW